MKILDKENFTFRIKDSLEFLDSAKDNLLKSRFKASMDHSITACIAANDAFTTLHLGKIANLSHYEAIDLHRTASKSFSENKGILLKELLDERHKITHTINAATKEQAKISMINAEKFISWIKVKLPIGAELRGI